MTDFRTVDGSGVVVVGVDASGSDRRVTPSTLVPVHLLSPLAHGIVVVHVATVVGFSPREQEVGQAFTRRIDAPMCDAARVEGGTQHLVAPKEEPIYTPREIVHCFLHRKSYHLNYIIGAVI